MTDPAEGLTSFQAALDADIVTLQKGALDPNIHVHLDHPAGSPRFTYVRLKGKTVTSLVMLVPVDHLDGLPCFQMGCAVPEKFRGQGLAQCTMLAALAELEAGLGRNGVSAFYVEAVVGIDNEPSKRIAEKVLSSNPEQVTDKFSGQPAYHYVKRIGTKA
ncbi:GNAT family N-acetyltransferase [Reyranella aquatilis]|uniref:GNAT family N-acetyltransferase n=1 Tax=Reyranella aquatilis TaxID=2035356 RepID=A0ABS8L3F2_9HYPH|nr:GNAT family protein [Reyranella aquatilis]MCC8432879.1 GNAT family N-acetyltransferase [Reyranella aquatilis]